MHNKNSCEATRISISKIIYDQSEIGKMAEERKASPLR